MTDLPSLLVEIQTRVRAREYRLSAHAEREREADRITIREIQVALLSNRAEIVENYPDDPRGASCLVLGFTDEGSPIHFVCTLAVPDVLILIALYRPDPRRWSDWRVRQQDG